VAALLHETRLWGDLPEAELAALAERARTISYAAGERIMRKGEHGGSMFLLLDGEVSVRLADPAGGERESYTQQRGEICGHMSALTGAPRFATVRATGPVTLAAFDKASLAPLVEAHPEVVETVAQEILRIHQAERELRKMSSMLDALASAFPRPQTPGARLRALGFRRTGGGRHSAPRHESKPRAVGIRRHRRKP
jgi:CRP-like cAMP-binding protein